MISSMNCLKNFRLKRNASESPFDETNRARMCSVFALPSTMGAVPGKIPAPNASEPVMISQPAESRTRIHSQPNRNNLTTYAEPVVANLNVPITANTCHIPPAPVKHNVLEFLLEVCQLLLKFLLEDCQPKTALLLGI